MLLRRVRILSSIAIVAGLIGFPAGPANAGEQTCDTTCQAQVTWYWHVQQTLYRQWLAGVVRAMPEAECIRHRESRGNYHAENASSSASGAYQFLISTSNNVSAAMGRHDLVGKPAGTWTDWDQDLAWAYLFARAGWGPWGGGC